MPWDTDFLGFPVARLAAAGLAPAELAAAMAAARHAGFRLVYVVAVPADAPVPAAMQQAGAQLFDRKATFAMSLLAPGAGGAPAAAVGTATEYTPQLESLAWQSGEYSRFRLDARFALHVFKDLYSRWLRSSLAGTIARRVLVWRDAAGTEQGLLTLGEKNNRADIGLLAVDARARGQRVGQALVAAAVAQASDWGYQELQVVTQRDNEPACRFYEKCGFALAHEEHIYHWWL
ncbi:GNAT family N-acetyltransferase [Hymenobacter nivis]|uniref:GNAT family N-acetyltransferase n=1 Tax=Hymenobacter nivis TaxID=1850093 RepID=A0A502HF14_9BACT|nr:GNAT family N-acetyltransferase [Hymenobacter nivis]TPG72252.1 GNAT family N-acetyltransferase [Hymenobacter nivis]